MRWSPRPWLRRPFAALIAVWFALVMVEPAALHSCPVHAGHAMAGSGSFATHDTHHPAAAPGHADHDAAAQVPGQSDHGGCTCPGACTASGAGVALPGRMGVETSEHAVATTGDRPAVETHAPARAPFVLPFPNGPPAPRTVA